MALYGIAVGLSVASIFDLRSTDDAVPEEIVGHAPAQRVLIVHTNDYPLMKVEQLLESDGAIEVIHRAA